VDFFDAAGWIPASPQGRAYVAALLRGAKITIAFSPRTNHAGSKDRGLGTIGQVPGLLGVGRYMSVIATDRRGGLVVIVSLAGPAPLPIGAKSTRSQALQYTGATSRLLMTAVASPSSASQERYSAPLTAAPSRRVWPDHDDR
jgi:hypothetical protein